MTLTLLFGLGFITGLVVGILLYDLYIYWCQEDTE